MKKDIMKQEIITGYTSTNVKDRCSPCKIKINDLGAFQCFDCKVRLSLRKKNERDDIIRYLKERHGSVWKKEFENLKLTRKLVKAHKYDQLTVCRHTYEISDQNTRIERIFYEKSGD